MIYIIVSTSNKKNKYKGETDADRIEVKEYKDSDGTYMYRPIYYFRALNGTTLSNYICVSSSSSSSYPDLSKKKVYYNLENPNECLTEYDASTAFIIYFFLIIPLACIIVGIVMIIKQIKVMNYIESGANNDYSGQNSNNNNYNYNPNTPVYNNYNAPIYNYSSASDPNQAGNGYYPNNNYQTNN